MVMDKDAREKKVGPSKCNFCGERNWVLQDETMLLIGNVPGNVGARIGDPGLKAIEVEVYVCHECQAVQLFYLP